MFTGIVEEVGLVESRQGGRLSISASLVLEDLRVGDSIAVNGACLTATQVSDRGFCVDLSPETLRRTHLGSLGPGSGVNLERPLPAGGRLGGHIMQGHVDATGLVRSMRPRGEGMEVRFSAPQRLMPYIVEKGFIAIDGASLTVVRKGASSFSVAVIPYTLAHTVLGSRRPGDRVNLEVDILAKYVESLLAKAEPVG